MRPLSPPTIATSIRRLLWSCDSCTFTVAAFKPAIFKSYQTMGSYSIGEALQLLLEKSQWKPKVFELRIREEWEAIVGKTIARYTRSTSLENRVLTIYTDVAALKQELQLGKDQLITKVNLYFGERVVSEIVIR